MPPQDHSKPLPPGVGRVPLLRRNPLEMFNLAKLHNGKARGYWLPGQIPTGPNSDVYSGKFYWPLPGSPLIMPQVVRVIVPQLPGDEDPEKGPPSNLVADVSWGQSFGFISGGEHELFGNAGGSSSGGGSVQGFVSPCDFSYSIGGGGVPGPEVFDELIACLEENEIAVGPFQYTSGITYDSSQLPATPGFP